MIYVNEVPVSTPSPASSQGSDLLDALMEHPTLISAADSFRDIPERKVSEEFGPLRTVYIFQREYATVDPALVDLVGTDEATTCVGLVIRNRQSRMTSVAHLDLPEVVDIGLNQMLSKLVDHASDAVLDVHLIGAFDDASPKHTDHSTTPASHVKRNDYSLSICTKIVEALQKSQEQFHIQTLFVLRHNTRRDTEGTAHPIFNGFLVETSTGSVAPASFDRTSRCPDEIVRRIRLCACSEDPSWNGWLLDTYDTHADRFVIAPCSWTKRQLDTAIILQGLSDSEILFTCSTSPSDEGPDFVNNERRKWEYLIRHPSWQDTFPRRKPHVFTRTASGWGRFEE